MPYPSRATLKFIAIVVGIFATTVPVIVFNGWLKKQGDDEVSLTAALALSSAELRLAQAASALKDLSARGIESCRPPQLEAMRATALRTGPVKQVMLIGAGGDVMCIDSGGNALRQEVLASAAAAAPGTMLDVVRLPGSEERFLRIRRLGPPDKPALGALVPASLLLPHASVQGGRLAGHARMTLADGTPIGESGTAEASAQPGRFTETQQSRDYPIAMTIAMPRNGVIAHHDDLRRIGIVITGGIAVVILLFALLLTKREKPDPAADLARAVADDEFVPYYQPIVDLQTGRLLGAEVLVRWKQPDGSLIEPSTFVLLLESSGLVLDFTRNLMRRVCKEIGPAVGQRPNMTVAFNIAPRHFDDALILHDVGTIFDGTPIRLSQLVLELTERHEVVNFTAMRRTVAALQRVGCKVAIDDVGTGHSGLSYILKLAVDIIKIDKMFVEAISSEGHSKAIIETLIDLAKNMRMEIVAEGVESFDQVTYLRERGIGAAQGYVFAPPLPAASFLSLLEAMDPVPAAGRAEKAEGGMPAIQQPQEPPKVPPKASLKETLKSAARVAGNAAKPASPARKAAPKSAAAG